jgi:hypothetical protein
MELQFSSLTATNQGIGYCHARVGNRQDLFCVLAYTNTVYLDNRNIAFHVVSGIAINRRIVMLGADYLT